MKIGVLMLTAFLISGCCLRVPFVTLGVLCCEQKVDPIVRHTADMYGCKPETVLVWDSVAGAYRCTKVPQ
jgi:hypothetical protein